MTTLIVRRLAFGTALALALSLTGGGLSARQATSQRQDQEYAKRIKDNTPDSRILTELIDHMPVSDTVPSPLKFLGYIPGENNRITYHKDIVRYLDALDKASERVTMWPIGKSEEGREMYAVAVADNGGDWLMSIAPDRRFQGLESLVRVKGSDLEVIVPTGPDEGPRRER